MSIKLKWWYLKNKREKMKELIKYLAVPTTAALLLSGCASDMYTPVAGGKIVQNKNDNSSYIVFSRPEFAGAALMNTIVEFDPNTYKTKYVGTLGAETRLVYKTTPGTHYFFMEGGENDDMIKITTAKSKEYYVHTTVGMGVVAGRFYFKPLRYPNLALAETLKSKTCTPTTLNQYGFKQIKDEVNELTGELKYKSKKHNITIECRRGSIHSASYNGQSVSNINDADLIQPSAKAKALYTKNVAKYQKEIQEDYPSWRSSDMSKTAMNTGDGKSLQ